MLTNDKYVDLFLEDICSQGCKIANKTIQQLEQGHAIDIPLTSNQRVKLLQELKSIMAVYSGSCAYSKR